jgi:DNA-binding MarR family transcriptional regulator
MGNAAAVLDEQPPLRPYLPASLMVHTGFLLHQTAEEVGELVEARLAPLELKGPQYGLLALLEEAAPLSQHDAAKRLHVDRTTMVAMVDDLEERGRVERRRDPTDRRKNALHLTAPGRAVVKRAHRVVAAAEERYFEGLTEGQRNVLHRILTMLDKRAQVMERRREAL